jgi:hypothetical protein
MAKKKGFKAKGGKKGEDIPVALPQNYGDYDYFGWPKKDDLPRIILGIIPPDRAFEESPRYLWKEPKFKDRTWLKIAHQTAGLSCNQKFIIGTILTPKSPEILRSINLLCDKWLDSNMGCWGLSLKEANEYENDLWRLFGANVGCNSSWKDLEEAWYPIDCTKNALNTLTSDTLPDNLDDLILWENGWERAMGCVNRWSIRVLGLNGD